MPQEEKERGEVSQEPGMEITVSLPLWGPPLRGHSEGATLRQRMMLTHEFWAPVALQGKMEGWSLPLPRSR